ncbi:MAG: NAD(P)/FAD-dependent oxidoreductase [Actinomycetes bacterium]
MAKRVAPHVRTFDVAIIGAGVVGAAIARELAHFELSILLIDAKSDVGAGTSKANTAILHTGFDMVPGSLESRLVSRGYALLRDYAREVGISFESCGALLVAWNDEELANLSKIQEKAIANGYHETYLVGVDALYAKEPHLGSGVLGALAVPGEWIIDPWSTTLAYATQAKSAGAILQLNTRVERISQSAHLHTLHTNQGEFEARYLVNAAGLYSDVIDAEFGFEDFVVTPRRGELMVFDKLARSLVSHILLPVPSSMGKGVLVSPTVFGNVMLGPTAENLSDKRATESSITGLAFLQEKGRKIMPALLDEEITAIYAGLRAATEHPDFQISLHAPQRYVTVGGIRSTGLTASMAIAEHVRDLLTTSGLDLGQQGDLPAIHIPALGESGVRPYLNDELIAATPSYGEIVCHCERVTRGEIDAAMISPIPPRDQAALGRRTRATLGRCQGFYCHAEVRALLENAGGAL